MTVSYTNTFDDLLALYEHHLMADAKWQRWRLWRVYGLPLLYLAVCFFIDLYQGDLEMERMLGKATPWAFLSFYMRFRYRRWPRKEAVKFYRICPPTGVLCEHAVTLSERGYSIQTGEVKEFQEWSAVPRVEFTRAYVFLYETVGSAHMIPRRELGDEVFGRVSERIQGLRGLTRID